MVGGPGVGRGVVLVRGVGVGRGVVLVRGVGVGRSVALFLAILGPGLITATADNDSGGIATYLLAGAQYG